MANKTVSIHRVATVAGLFVVVFVVYVQFLFELNIRFRPVLFRDWLSATVVSVVAVVLLFMSCRSIDQLMPGVRRWVRGGSSLFLVSGLYMVAHMAYTDQLIGTWTFVYISPLLVVGVFVYFALYAGKQWEVGYRDQERLPIWELNNPKIIAHLESISADRAAGILEYFRRAEALTEKAGSVLWVIIVVLTFTAVFIIFAGRISEIGVVETDHLAVMVAERAEIEGKIERLDQELKRIGERMDMMSFDVTRLKERDQDYERLADIVERWGATARGVAAPRKELQSRVAKYDEQIWSARNTALTGGSRGLAETEGDKKPESKTGRGGLLVASTVTRLGVAIIAIYLVQILLSLYRYNTRMAADYLAHADTLMLAGLDAKAVKALHTVLLPKVNYGKVPSTVLQRSTDAVRTRLRRRGVPGGNGGGGDDDT